MNTTPLNSRPASRRLCVLWRDHCWSQHINLKRKDLCPQMTRMHADNVCRVALLPHLRASASSAGNSGFGCGGPRWEIRGSIQNFRRAFTILEMLIVVAIIGFLAAVALPHLPGMTRANSMTTAVQQMLGDCALARQLAMSRRSTVYMVFAPPYSGQLSQPVNQTNSFNNLMAHQYGAYALVSKRSVGDQPGQSHPLYLTEWKPLPDGVFIAPWKFPGPNTGAAVTVVSTNTLTGVTNPFVIYPFAQDQFPFPAADAVPANGIVPSLPYIGFSPLGQLTTNGDEYIPLDRGHVQYLAGLSKSTFPATPIETPAGNAVNNCNIIHIDWLTARAKIERNQQR